MVVAIASAVLTMACQGCVAVSPHDHVRIEPAVPPTVGMMMAAPGTGPVVTSVTQDSNKISVHVADGLPTRFTGTPLGLGSEMATMAFAGTPADFSSGSLVAASADKPELGWSGSGALTAVTAERSAAAALNPALARVEKDIAAEVAFSAPSEVTGLTFDVGVAPRIAVREDGEVLAQRFGGEVRIGQDFDLLDSNGQPQGWYLFAGADGEALIWDADRNGFTPQLNDMALTDQVTVGDLQAGVSIQRGGGQLSLSYIRREVKYRDRNGGFSENEDFAGISFTMRR
ncbi:lipid A-modifier LpxR family protein [Hyphomonas sp.]|uniref:lipid A-modifier LpxR family protein n=1 Tax=Hyphomonas sp. TaxID=87 RepID=UPI003241F693